MLQVSLWTRIITLIIVVAGILFALPNALPPQVRAKIPGVLPNHAVNLGLDLRIPPTYVSDENQRLRAYKKIADAASDERANEVLEEMEDRYGPAPDGVKQLLRFATLKSAAERLGVESIDRRAGAINLKFHQKSLVDPARLMHYVQATPGAQFTPAGILRVPMAGTPLDALAAALGALEAARA